MKSLGSLEHFRSRCGGRPLWLTIGVACICLFLETAVLAEGVPMVQALASHIANAPTSFQVTFIREDRTNKLPKLKCVRYQDGARFYQEQYTLSDKGDPLFNGAFSFDGKVYKNLFNGALRVSKDADKIANAVKIFWPKDPVYQIYQPFVPESDCLKLLNSDALKAAVLLLPLKGNLVNKLSFITENAELKVEANGKGLPKLVTGIIDGFDVSYDFAGEFPLGKITLPLVTTTKMSPIKGGWKNYEAMGKLDEVCRLVESETKIRESGFMQRESQNFQIPRELIRIIIDMDLGTSTMFQP